MRERIVTRRLVLEPVTDAAAAAILAGDLSVVRAGEGWPHADTLDGLRHSPGWLVTLDGVVIGDCGTHGEPDAAGEVEIGYGLAAPYRGLGYGTELVRGLSHALLGRPGVRRVTAGIEPGNLPSRRAVERCGFVLEHEDGELCRYALAARGAGEIRPLAEDD